jgi:FlaA1/EpsC-like NDP-sugar epimerase
MTLLPSDVEQFLGRPVCDVLSDADREAVQGQRALVTGAGGSVGSELSRQLAAAGASRLCLMDHSEYALFRLASTLHQHFPAVEIIPALGDVTRRADVRLVCRGARPDVVYHAAAYKHVTFAETAPVQALRVNALGALEVAQAARAAGARFVLISSDKAARPTSVMGATKRCAELLVLRESTPTFRPIVVRFGNILGSSGSVAEILWEHARAGRPLPITDPDATRYFMTASEAVSLVLKADLTGRGPGIFWLDMGERVRIGDLVERIRAHAAAAGLPPVRTEIIGLRPGEKLHEELTSQGLSMRPTSHARILSARQPPVAAARTRTALTRARRACAAGSARDALDVLRHLVDDFDPSDVACHHARHDPGQTRPVRHRHAVA